jgi:tRNA threonylcarbamoyladenosine biosynthesis protein TsaE
LRHVDAWRLADEQELETLGWNEWVGEVGSLTIIEWASRIESAMPPTATRLRLDYDEGSGRVLWDASGEMP